jgi:hypothetical protein
MLRALFFGIPVAIFRLGLPRSPVGTAKPDLWIPDIDDVFVSRDAWYQINFATGGRSSWLVL